MTLPEKTRYNANGSNFSSPLTLNVRLTFMFTCSGRHQLPAADRRTGRGSGQAAARSVHAVQVSITIHYGLFKRVLHIVEDIFDSKMCWIFLAARLPLLRRGRDWTESSTSCTQRGEWPELQGFLLGWLCILTNKFFNGPRVPSRAFVPLGTMPI